MRYNRFTILAEWRDGISRNKRMFIGIFSKKDGG